MTLKTELLRQQTDLLRKICHQLEALVQEQRRNTDTLERLNLTQPVTEEGQELNENVKCLGVQISTFTEAGAIEKEISRSNQEAYAFRRRIRHQWTKIKNQRKMCFYNIIKNEGIQTIYGEFLETNPIYIPRKFREASIPGDTTDQKQRKLNLSVEKVRMEMCRLKEQTDWVVASGLLLVVYLLADIYRLEPSFYHTYSSLIRQYIALKIYLITGYVAITRFRKVCQKVKSSQEAALQKILKDTAKSAFVKDHGLSTVKTVDEFRRTIPLLTYDDYLPYVNRVLGGEDNVLFCAKVDYLALTSGTTSCKSKLYPKSLKLFIRNALNLSSLISWLVYSISGSEKLRLMVLSGCPTKSKLNDRGIASGPISAAYNMTSFPYWSSPKVSFEITNDEHKAYVDLLFGLRDRKLNGIYAIVAPTLLRLFKVLEKHWRNICDDIERGTLSSDIPLKTEMRNQLEPLMSPDPIRAAELRGEFSKGFHGIVPRVWPHCNMVLGISSGTFRVYGDIVKQNYLGNVTLLSQCHAATEGVFGVNLWPELSDVHYAPTAGAYFFEWLAVDDVTADPVLLHEVELFREYEMVITTFDGLYRYRTGDVVEFTKYYYELPIYKYVRRLGDFLNCVTEKVPECVISSALGKIFTKFKETTLIDYTCTESSNFEKVSGGVEGELYHLIFVEIEGDATCLGEINAEVDEEIRSLNHIYQRYRSQGTIQAVKMVPLRSGAFQRFKAKRMTDNPNTSSLQYKVPRVIRGEDLIRFFVEERSMD